MIIRAAWKLDVNGIGMTENNEPMQTTDSGLTIPIPTKEEVMAALLKVARPVRKQPKQAKKDESTDDHS